MKARRNQPVNALRGGSRGLRGNVQRPRSLPRRTRLTLPARRRRGSGLVFFCGLGKERFTALSIRRACRYLAAKAGAGDH